MPMNVANVSAQPPHTTHRAAHWHPFRIAVAVVVLLCATSSVAAAERVDGASAANRADTSPEAPLVISTNAQDRAALRAARRASRLSKQASTVRDRIARIEERILMLEQLLDEAAGEEQRMQEALATRLVAEYTAGNSTQEWSYLLDASNAAEMVDRARTLRAARTQTEALARAQAMTVQRIEDLTFALEELRSLAHERAMRLEDRAAHLEGQISIARDAHMEASTLLDGDPAVDGTWLVANPSTPDFSALTSLFGPGAASYTGGAVTPREPSTSEQVMRVLQDPRIQIYAGGIADIKAGRVDGRVLDALSVLAARFGQVTVTSLITGHGVYTASGNISAHTYGCAVDIGTIQGQLIQPSTQGPGSITEQAVKLLAALPDRLAPHQVISLTSFGGPTLAMADHHDHIHLGYHC
jgi:peptidoglycan hydrolase CwlO-like protein